MHVTHCVSTECVLNGLTLAILSLLSGRASVLIKLEGQGLVTFFFFAKLDPERKYNEGCRPKQSSDCACCGPAIRKVQIREEFLLV